MLASDGANLAAAFQTIVEIGDELLLMRILDQAFPGCVFYSDNTGGRFRMMMQREGLSRPLEPAEFSDGTLRFLCLAVALLSPRLPHLSPSTNRKTACIRRCCPPWQASLPRPAAIRRSGSPATRRSWRI
ncbi:putative RecF protein [Enterobacter hormaechei]|nr:putative RecF protein [Enterobacter hormaechei]